MQRVTKGSRLNFTRCFGLLLAGQKLDLQARGGKPFTAAGPLDEGTTYCTFRADRRLTKTTSPLSGGPALTVSPLPGARRFRTPLAEANWFLRVRHRLALLREVRGSQSSQNLFAPVKSRIGAGGER